MGVLLSFSQAGCRRLRGLLCLALVAAFGVPAPLLASTSGPTTEPAVFALTASEMVEGKGSGSISPLLLREILRQAVLIAARDGLQLPTRDQVLREPLGNCPFSLTVTGAKPTVVQLSLQNHDEPVWSISFPNFPWADNTLPLIKRMEKLSRTGIVDALKQQGFSGQANQINPGAPAPAECEGELKNLEILSQFAAVRAAHQAIRSDGESLARLGVLVRGYANLGQLTEFLWNASDKVFFARSLLYAQRMVATHPKSSLALWYRAYARALTGLYRPALHDLMVAKRLHTDPAPSWVALLEPLCRYDPGKLLNLGTSDASQEPLAMFFAFLTVEHCGSQGAVMNFAQAAAQVNPECLRLIDAMCDNTGPGMLNSLTVQGPRIFNNTLRTRLGSMNGLPDAVMAQIPDQQWNMRIRLAATKALVEQADDPAHPSEPSWSALGRLIEEITFAQVRRRADLIANQWGIDASDFAHAARPLITDHPYRNLIEAYGLEYRNDQAGIGRLMHAIRLHDIVLPMQPLLDMMAAHGIEKDSMSRPIRSLAWLDSDLIAGDMDKRLENYATNGPAYNKWLATDLQYVAPDSPLRIAVLIHDDWGRVENRIPKWEQDHGDYPTVAMALGRKYASLHRWADAARCFKRYIAVSPDYTGYTSLANVYKSRGDDDRWLATLDEFLKKGQSYGLESTRVQAKIADYYNEKRQWQRAKPYAEEAAESGAEWAMECAARTAEGMGNYKRAELWMRRTSKHYDSPAWYFWCRRTGMGDVSDAKVIAAEWAHKNADDTGSEALVSLALYQIADGNLRQARADFQRRLKLFPGPFSCLQVVLLSMELKDRTAIAPAFDGYLKTPQAAAEKGTALDQIVHMIKACLASSPPSKLDLHAVDAAIAAGDVRDRPDAFYFVGRFLDLTGDEPHAKAYLLECVRDPRLRYGNANRYLAKLLLRECGLPLAQVDAAIGADDRPAPSTSQPTR